MNAYDAKRSLVLACDVASQQDLRKLVTATAELEFISGFKIGAMLALSVGLRQTCDTIRDRTDQDIIYDHQKFGTDIPAMCGGKLLDLLQNAGVSQVIAFPLAGIETLKAFVEGCRARNLEPVIGGEMTHPGFLVREGGYIANAAPARMYGDAVQLGVQRFVVPATKPRRMAKYRREIEEACKDPVFLFPGVGKGQGGDIVEAFRQVQPHGAIAIVGRGIYAQPDPGKAAHGLWDGVLRSFPT